ncbi:hypothetical protein [Rhodanobacter lindaniclasticus]
MHALPTWVDSPRKPTQVLQPFIDMQYALLRERAEHGQWVSPQARQTRLDQIEHDYRRDTLALGPPRKPQP